MRDCPAFEDAVLDFAGRAVFLDVDGTLAPDGSFDFSPAVADRVRELSAKNQVFLCTNKRAAARHRALAGLFSLPVVTARHRKPSRRVLDEAGALVGAPVVIGDKFLTDYLFAKRIGARFIRVKRKLSGRESLLLRFINLVDDLLWTLLRPR